MDPGRAQSRRPDLRHGPPGPHQPPGHPGPDDLLPRLRHPHAPQGHGAAQGGAGGLRQDLGRGLPPVQHADLRHREQPQGHHRLLVGAQGQGGHGPHRGRREGPARQGGQGSQAGRLHRRQLDEDRAGHRGGQGDGQREPERGHGQLHPAGLRHVPGAHRRRGGTAQREAPARVQRCQPEDRQGPPRCPRALLQGAGAVPLHQGAGRGRQGAGSSAPLREGDAGRQVRWRGGQGRRGRLEAQ